MKLFSLGTVAGLAFGSMLIGAVACSSSSSPAFTGTPGDDGGGSTSSGGSGGSSGDDGGGGGSSSGSGGGSSSGTSSSGGSSSSGGGDGGSSCPLNTYGGAACVSCLKSMCPSAVAACDPSMIVTCTSSSCIAQCVNTDAGSAEAGSGGCPSPYGCSALLIGGVKACNQGGVPPACSGDGGSGSCAVIPGSSCVGGFCVKPCS